MSLPTVRIEAGRTGRDARLLIDGEDWSSRVQALELRVSVNEPTVVVLEMMAGRVELDAEAAIGIVAKMVDQRMIELVGDDDE